MAVEKIVEEKANYKLTKWSINSRLSVEGLLLIDHFVYSKEK